jgi:hypothetical protein
METATGADDWADSGGGGGDDGGGDGGDESQGDDDEGAASRAGRTRAATTESVDYAARAALTEAARVRTLALRALVDLLAQFSLVHDFTGYAARLWAPLAPALRRLPLGVLSGFRSRPPALLALVHAVASRPELLPLLHAAPVPAAAPAASRAALASAGAPGPARASSSGEDEAGPPESLSGAAALRAVARCLSAGRDTGPDRSGFEGGQRVAKGCSVPVLELVLGTLEGLLASPLGLHLLRPLIPVPPF